MLFLSTIRLLEASSTCCSLLWITLIRVGIKNEVFSEITAAVILGGDHYERERASGSPLIHFPACAHMASYLVEQNTSCLKFFCHLNGISCGTLMFKLVRQRTRSRAH